MHVMDMLQLQLRSMGMTTAGLQWGKGMVGVADFMLQCSNTRWSEVPPCINIYMIRVAAV